MTLRKPDARFVLDHKLRKTPCPSCGKTGRFRRYLDRATGQHLPEHVGVCDRESNCGYSYTAKQWLSDGGSVESMDRPYIPPPPPKRSDWRCPEKFFKMTQGYDAAGEHHWHANNFIAYLLGTRLGDDPLYAFQEYQVGTYPKGKNYPDLTHAAVFWQIGTDGLPRSGKVIQYDPATGKRRKDIKATWMHSIITGKSMDELGCAQVYFGTHLLKKRPAATVCIVESEKTAVICSCLYPDYVWLATGGANALTIEKSMCLSGSDVILFPDKGMYAEWSQKALDIEPMLSSIYVSDILECIGADEGSDIADYLLPEDLFAKMGIDLFPVAEKVEEVVEEKVAEECHEPLQDSKVVSTFDSPLDRIVKKAGKLVEVLDLDLSRATLKPYKHEHTEEKEDRAVGSPPADGGGAKHAS